ncbi:macro domain-containing protein [Bacillus sp. CH_48]|uniref:macro domain-containing protein n=1 Tax=Bacillus TaxID=1386 RepID=UPI00147913FD|nr:macro domain-containing protein [Bacillus thuringiensis]MCU5539956.1 DUF6430 domain-containing protein [Bacillus cereus]NNG93871.1 hypothetical protein [Bacillus thuringiensis]HDR7695926.1 hypothetical protein [Bacillus thuringiensis]
MKVGFWDKEIKKEFRSKVSVISTVFSLALIWLTIPEEYKKYSGMVFSAGLMILYVFLWFRANRMKEVKLKINNSVVHVKEGDVFREVGLKVIPFNEYFDTQVDNKIISKRTLNGMYIERFIRDVGGLNHLIKEDRDLKRKIIKGENNRRFEGNSTKYTLGSIFKNGEYLLLAFSKFDEDNRAYLSMNEYVNCLMNFWNEIDIVHNGESIVIPLLGSGITRFKDYPISEQELLELILWTFKVSRVKFPYSENISIVIHATKVDKINFYKLREMGNGL